ncbi:MAG: hypothetical protein K2O97_09680, partial [Acetatifactor sp.]|nr:hypothetical protein [Acetatifactor sp.]
MVVDMEFECILAFLVFFPFAAGLLAYFCGKRCNMAAVISVVAEFVGILLLILIFHRQAMLCH